MAKEPAEHRELQKLQSLIVEVMRVERNHRIPASERHENVIEHSYSAALLAWKIYEVLQPPLELEKILKYALVHDFAERGQCQDTNTYAKPHERQSKKKREAHELKKIEREMSGFGDLIGVLQAYEAQEDEESRFIWCVDKLQAKVLGMLDEWRPYRLYGVTYEQYCAKDEEILTQCPPYLKPLFTNLFAYFQCVYYDQPVK